jgi:lysophospholipase
LSEILSAWKRATPQAPNGYTPQGGDCPSQRPSIRTAGRLSDQESAWLKQRRQNTIDPLKDLLGRLNIAGFDTNGFINDNRNNASLIPNIAIAASGGGYRALMNGAGAIAAFDTRTPNSTSAGHLGGLLQSATYLAGLSGGGWLVGSLMTNNFTSVQDIINTTPSQSGSLWQFGNSILKGPDQGSIQILDTASYFKNIADTVTGKSSAGFNTSITDIWSRALSFQLVNATDGGPAFTWSSIADDTQFSSANTPMPILVADERFPGEKVISANATVFEFNPWEFGSWDPTLYGFAPIKYAGSKFSNGTLPDKEQCVRGFDNAAFIMGTSSSLFNQFLLNIDSTSVPDFIKSAVTNVLQDLGNDNNDIADWSPNAFRGFNRGSNPSADMDRLTLVDGGEDLQNIPLHPLIQPNRAVDVIFAIDSSADTPNEPGANWPNGTALVATYERSLNKTMENGTAFPAIPDVNTFINLGLNNHPTFFGCNASNLTGPAPLIVYLPNSPYVFNSNISTFQQEVNNTERNAIIQNGYNVATMGNATRDQQWPTCVGCAIMSRAWHKTNAQVPDVCNQCFQRYCWNGTLDSRTPPPYVPTSVYAQIKVNAAIGLTPNLLSLGMMMSTIFALLM